MVKLLVLVVGEGFLMIYLCTHIIWYHLLLLEVFCLVSVGRFARFRGLAYLDEIVLHFSGYGIIWNYLGFRSVLCGSLDGGYLWFFAGYLFLASQTLELFLLLQQLEVLGLVDSGV